MFTHHNLIVFHNLLDPILDLGGAHLLLFNSFVAPLHTYLEQFPKTPKRTTKISVMRCIFSIRFLRNQEMATWIIVAIMMTRVAAIIPSCGSSYCLNVMKNATTGKKSNNSFIEQFTKSEN